MYLIIDSETTGLPRNWKAPITDLANWPRVIQMAWSLFDRAGQPIESATHLIKPEGFRIPAEVQRIHGISTERALAEGRALPTVLQEFAAAAEKSDFIIAHNVKFDESVISAEFFRLKLPSPFVGKRRICTMMQSTELRRIQGPYGYKWPTLSQLHQELFQTGYEEAHDAGADVAACAKCFFELKQRGVISL
ncbi:MAG: 3'-5' exonuclease [Acidobacteriota bacterium]|nr:3'-5' exonuclease [Acidobacteriota bacterium]